MMRADFLFLLAYPLFIVVFLISDLRTSLIFALVTAGANLILSYLPKIIVQKNSYSRRKSIGDQVLRDQNAFENEKRPSPKSEDDDWEQVSSEPYSRVATKSTSKNDYDGFIGFFHPFA